MFTLNLGNNPAYLFLLLLFFCAFNCLIFNSDSLTPWCSFCWINSVASLLQTKISFIRWLWYSQHAILIILVQSEWYMHNLDLINIRFYPTKLDGGLFGWSLVGTVRFWWPWAWIILGDIFSSWCPCFYHLE